jgi:hypothetical protein
VHRAGPGIPVLDGNGDEGVPPGGNR